MLQSAIRYFIPPFYFSQTPFRENGMAFAYGGLRITDYSPM